MRLFRWLSIGSWTREARASTLDPRQHEWRIQWMERDLGLPIKAAILGIVFYYLFLSNWMSDTYLLERLRLAQDAMQYGFFLYLAINVGAAFILAGMRNLPSSLVQWAVCGVEFSDGLFLGGLVLITGGLQSVLYWFYVAVIIRNSITVTAPGPQIALNLLMCMFYLGAVVLEANISELDRADLEVDQRQYIERAEEFQRIDSAGEKGTQVLGKPLALRMLLLGCVTAWCYGIQVLLDRQRRSQDEERELTLRRDQLEASGRLAAEIAHQLKNPLGIINNAAFTLQRTVKEGKGTITQQIQIIREEVERSDRIITELMGYAKLAEGRVEKLDVPEELDRAINQVFPAAVKYEVRIHRDYAPALPHLLAQRNDIAEVFVNIMQNAREAMGGRGNLWVSAAHGNGFSVLITIADDGPGIAPQHLTQIFEPYFTTREKGSGLGLAIVKHNTELYGGTVRAESELGNGTRFVLQFPARTLMKLRP